MSEEFREMPDNRVPVELKYEPPVILLLDTWTMQQRHDILRELLATYAAGPLPLEAIAPGTALLPLGTSDNSRLVQPGQLVTMSAPVFKRFLPQRLVIAETAVKVTTYTPLEETVEEVPPKWAFWRTGRVTKRWERNKAETRMVVVPRHAWQVSQLLVGQQLQFGGFPALGGELFGPHTELEFDGSSCEPGISISLSVKNTGHVEAPFLAVLVGRYGG